MNKAYNSGDLNKFSTKIVRKMYMEKVQNVKRLKYTKKVKNSSVLAKCVRGNRILNNYLTN